jgi:hypothetical protein
MIKTEGTHNPLAECKRIATLNDQQILDSRGSKTLALTEMARIVANYATEISQSGM